LDGCEDHRKIAWIDWEFIRSLVGLGLGE